MSRRFTDRALELIASQFKMLSEPTRLRILNQLRGGEKTVSELVEETDTGQANVSKHLGVLHRHGMVERRKEGLYTYYRISDPLTLELCDVVCDRLESRRESRPRLTWEE